MAQTNQDKNISPKEELRQLLTEWTTMTSNFTKQQNDFANQKLIKSIQSKYTSKEEEESQEVKVKLLTAILEINKTMKKQIKYILFDSTYEI